MKRASIGIALAIVAIAASLALARINAVDLEPRVDRIFARWTSSTPGCAVGVAVDGKPALVKAYGMADLEHDVPLTPDSILESGSVAKQFTAAAVLLLAREGKLSLDDPVRKHIPELPDYGAPLTVRHLLTHTSGLRDWGSLYGIAGMPRTSRTFTQAYVLDILSRQKSLNFTPGTQWSYSNSGYNLAAIIVSRVSGEPFAELTRKRLFEPLEMTHTSWRDDFERIVKGRAIAYDEREGAFRQNMPFEDAYGNGGLLTTVGDLLKWNRNFQFSKVGDAEFRRIEQTPGTFNDGKPHNYALGLYIRKHRGIDEVSHSGSTAGYTTFLTRFPSFALDVAVLCNVSSARAGDYAYAVSDAYLSGRVKLLDPDPPSALRPEPSRTWKPTPAELEAFTGSYRSDEIETTFTVAIKDGSLELRRRPDTVIVLRPLAPDTFDGSIGEVKFHRDAGGRVAQFGIKQDRVWDLRFDKR